MQYCSLQHQTLILSLVTSTTGYCFCFGSIPSFFLELFLHWSPVTYWAPTDLGGSSFGILSFCLLILFMGFSSQEYWSALPLPSPVDHVLSDLSTMTVRLGWPHTAWLSFTELDKTVVLWSDWLVFCDYGFRVSALWRPLATPTNWLGFLLLWTRGISSQPPLLTDAGPHRSAPAATDLAEARLWGAAPRQGQGQRPWAPGCDSAGVAQRSYPTPEARSGGREDVPHTQARCRTARGATLWL